MTWSRAYHSIDSPSNPYSHSIFFTTTTTMSTPTNQTPSQPIAIDSNTAGVAHSQNRRRSNSLWSNPGLSPSTSPVSPTMSTLQTPSSTYSTLPRPSQASPTSATSPLSYFLSGSPVKSAYPWTTSLPGGGGGGGGGGFQGKGFVDGSAIVEDDDSGNNTFQKFGHSRTASASWSTAGHERGAGVMRRLSLGGALGAPRVSHLHQYLSPHPLMLTDPFSSL